MCAAAKHKCTAESCRRRKRGQCSCQVPPVNKIVNDCFFRLSRADAVEEKNTSYRTSEAGADQALLMYRRRPSDCEEPTDTD